MKAKINLEGTSRKALVKAIEKITGGEAEYKKAPTFAYEIGTLTVMKDGTLDWDDEDFEQLLTELAEAGFEAAVEPEDLTISLPADTLDDAAFGRLEQITEAKASLLKKAFGTDSLEIIRDEERISFPWFKATDSDSTTAYMLFLTKLCDFVKEAKRITAKATEPDNEKYAFRCFLLRLGFIGDECKAARKILLKNLTGSSAWKDGGKHE